MKVGDVFENADPRRGGRLVRVDEIEVGGLHAIVSNLRDGRETRVLTANLEKRWRWRPVLEGSPAR